jgi:KaiC/GvpD/RAD55 family RecA-like ATPase
MRIGSGVPNFDRLVEGGFFVGSFILLYGPPHVGKSMFCRQFLCAGMKEEEVCTYITFDQSPKEIRDGLVRRGLNPLLYESTHRFTIVDCFGGEDREERYSLQKLDDVDQMNALINEVFQDLSEKQRNPGGRIVFDSISKPLSATTSPDDLVKMVHSFKRSLPKEQKSMMLVMHEGMQDSRFEALISHAMDVVIDMRSREEQNRIRRFMWIKAAHNINHSLEPHEYQITSDGLAIVDEKYGYVLF